MIERPVRDLHSSKQVQPLFCKVIVDGDKVTLESKGKDNKKQTISWKDIFKTAFTKPKAKTVSANTRVVNIGGKLCLL